MKRRSKLVKIEFPCMRCKSAVFCETWGEYKCTYYKNVVQETRVGSCPAFTQLKDSDNVKECMCEECRKRRKENDTE